ncbi:type I-E CRISPR-associated protein Cas7/Cse4/CasC [Patescibacteria group bacterium]|nr:type I-E CRISPR-associated protein Cas7/Cse4/CasC [Chloroflexota bacterium]MBU2233939.1 type I-E CRISPR-associated protein Cas7/Cse4/CasC [Patescibacteria group bacterium]MBU2264508.1 type I-E CRISPR-associated protein Cas7/Cse4/CasC [Patescibacteria group bacterium]
MDKNFINFHILISHSPSCLNRDDMNMQKSATFGGKRRVRISSQSLKRTMRKSPYFDKMLGQNSTRTRELNNLFSLLSKKMGEHIPKELIEKAISFLADKRDVTIDESRADAVAPWCYQEVEWFCNQLQTNENIMKLCEEFISITGNSDNDKKKKRSLIKSVYNILEKNEQLQGLYLALENNIDIALHGRMAASGLMKPLDGALAVAHVITTHTVDADIDWFTAVDDLQELGSGHLDTQEFSSGVFYRYASLNISQLQENLGNAPRKKALEIASHVLHLMATVVPSAKQQSFAAHNLADLAMVSFSDIPVSLANAFEEPIKPGPGFIKPSVKALHEYWQAVHHGYGLNERCAEFAIGHEPPEGITGKKTLENLKTWVQADGEV